MNYVQRAGASAYGVAALLLIFPLLDLIQATWPPRVGDVSWRVIAAGLLSRVVITPMLGLLLAFVAALILEQPRVLRALAIANALLLAAVLAGLSIFALDALQVRTQVALEGRENYDLGLALSFLKYGAVALLLALMAWSEWKSVPALARNTGRRARQSPLVVRQTVRRPEAKAERTGSLPLAADDSE